MALHATLEGGATLQAQVLDDAQRLQNNTQHRPQSVWAEAVWLPAAAGTCMRALP